MAQNIKQIHVGDAIKIKWIVDKDGQESESWYDAIVMKIHRMEGTRYLVCSVEYNDGTLDKSHIFWEKDYGTCWKFNYEDDSSDTEAEEEDDVSTENSDDSDDSVVEDNFEHDDRNDNNDNEWNWTPDWGDNNAGNNANAQNDTPKVVYVEPRNNLAYDIDNLSTQLSSIRSSVRAICIMYFITHLPLWIFVYLKMYEAVVGESLFPVTR